MVHSGFALASNMLPFAETPGNGPAVCRSMNKDEQKQGKPDREWARKVWQVVLEIPPGHVLTYGEVARLSGAARYARRVSQAMRWAPRDLALPWHRVINAQGKISFPPDSDGWRRQKERLESEGVVFIKGRINLDVYGYRGAVDRLLWGEA
jgi:methylated-DNA-protein-cysteine methyltransferase-like protein